MTNGSILQSTRGFGRLSRFPVAGSLPPKADGQLMVTNDDQVVLYVAENGVANGLENVMTWSGIYFEENPIHRIIGRAVIWLDR